MTDEGHVCHAQGNTDQLPMNLPIIDVVCLERLLYIIHILRRQNNTVRYYCIFIWVYISTVLGVIVNVNFSTVERILIMHTGTLHHKSTACITH